MKSRCEKKKNRPTAEVLPTVKKPTYTVPLAYSNNRAASGRLELEHRQGQGQTNTRRPKPHKRVLNLQTDSAWESSARRMPAAKPRKFCSSLHTCWGGVQRRLKPGRRVAGTTSRPVSAGAGAPLRQGQEQAEPAPQAHQRGKGIAQGRSLDHCRGGGQNQEKAKSGTQTPTAARPPRGTGGSNPFPGRGPARGRRPMEPSTEHARTRSSRPHSEAEKHVVCSSRVFSTL